MLEITQNSSSSSSSRRTVILSLRPSAHIWTPRSHPCAVMQAVSWRVLRPPRVCVFVLLLCKAAVRPSRRLLGPVLALMKQVRPGLLSATCSPAAAAAWRGGVAWRGSFACEVCVREDGCPPSQVTLTHFLCYHEAAHTFIFSRQEHGF